MAPPALVVLTTLSPAAGMSARSRWGAGPT